MAGDAAGAEVTVGKRVSARTKKAAALRAVMGVDLAAGPDFTAHVIVDTNARARAEQLTRICDRIRGGSSVDAACWREGISPDAARSRWRHAPAELALVEAARAEAEDVRREEIKALVAAGMPTAGATWMLERLHRGQYHLPSKVHVGGDEEAGPVRAEVRLTLAEATEAARGRDEEER